MTARITLKNTDFLVSARLHLNEPHVSPASTMGQFKGPGRLIFNCRHITTSQEQGTLSMELAIVSHAHAFGFQSGQRSSRLLIQLYGLLVGIHW
jgi:hypothetical protein